MKTKYLFRTRLFIVYLILLPLIVSGCHALAGGLAGAGIGGGVTRSWQGAAIGGGAGMLVGQVAEDVFDLHQRRGGDPAPSWSRIVRGDCERFRTEYERIACEEGQAAAERQNRQDRQWRARNYGYSVYRKR